MFAVIVLVIEMLDGILAVGGFLRMAKVHRSISAIATIVFVSRRAIFRPAQRLVIVIARALLRITFQNHFAWRAAAPTSVRQWVISARRWASHQGMLTRLRYAVAAADRVLTARVASVRILGEKIATKRVNDASLSETVTIGSATRRRLVPPQLISTAGAARKATFDLNVSRASIPNGEVLIDRWQFQSARTSMSFGGEAKATIRQTGRILPLNTQDLFRESEAVAALAGRREASLHKKSMCPGIGEHTKVFHKLTITPQTTIGAGDDTAPKSAQRESPRSRTNPPQSARRSRNGVAPAASRLLGSRKPFKAKWSHARCQIPITSDPKRDHFARTGNFNERYRDVCELTTERELPGASTNECAGLTFLRCGMQMFRDVTNWILLRRQRLFHQKAREHRGCSFVKPLFEKSINFLFEIGSMIQPGKFKGLKCWDGGLLKILPRWADTSGTHFGGLLG
jgi:hypothetical protein